MRTITRRNRTACSILALATALAVGPSPAAAQSFQGTGTPLVSGSATITTPNSTTTNIAVNNAQTVITWTPFDNSGTAPISFQAGGTTATFTGTSDFAVLNRIISNDASRRVDMFGTINSQICSAACATGGSIYFYSPGGFLIGGTASINVGSLVLSASPIAFNATTGAFIDTANRNEVVFGQALTPGATITTNPGSLITAPNSNSYVAFVAPRIIRAGDIVVDGQAAMVAADAATIRFAPDGLFDIEVDSGSSAASNAMTGGGDITGEASTGAGDNNLIYMVAVPKNQALSMAFSQGSNLGFDIAGAADVVGNAIVLSAGHDIVNGAIQETRSLGGGSGNTSINIFGTNTTSALTARATGNIDLFNTAGLNTSYAGDVYLQSPGNVWVNASGSDASLTFQRALTLDADGDALTAGGSGIGGWASLYASTGGAITVNGTTTVTADGHGGDTSVAGATGGTGIGGKAWIQAEGGGTITLNDAVSVSASGFGGDATGEGGFGGDGLGGFNTGAGHGAYVRAFGGGATLNIYAPLTVAADGVGGNAQVDGCVTCSGIGGDGLGGSAEISTGAGANSLYVSQNALVTANGTGGAGDGTGGDGSGGGSLTAGLYGTVVTFGNGSTLAFDSDLTLKSTGMGGTGGTGNGGEGTGGRVTTGTQSGVTSGSLSVDGSTSIDVSGEGGGANGTGRGGDGYGGDSDNGGLGATVSFVGNLIVAADGRGGYSESGLGGGGYGGQAWLDAFGSTVTVGGFAQLSAFATGGDGATAGGEAYGGDVYLIASGSNLTVGSAYLYADASGGDAANGDGGYAYGGFAEIRASAFTLDINGPAYASANGSGGNGGGAGNLSGDGDGGTAIIRAVSNGLLAIDGYAWAQANGFGGIDTNGDAASGDGYGGYASVHAATGGDVTVGSFTQVRANGEGGQPGEGYAGGDAGNGEGGTAEVFANGAGSTLTLGDTFIEARGFGSLGNIGVGGDGFGGSSELWAQSGGNVAITGGLYLDSDGIGGYDANGFGGGDGFGGSSTVAIYGTTASTAISVTGYTDVAANGQGANSLDVAGGFGGDGVGGSATVSATTGTISLVNLDVRATGKGGDTNAGTGGAGTGGSNATINANGGTITGIGTFVNVTTDGIGGNGATGGSGTGGGNILTGAGGASLVAQGAGQLTLAGTVSVTSIGQGGSGTTLGGAAQGGNATINALVGGDIDLTGRVRLSSDGYAGIGAIGRGGVSSLLASGGGTAELFELNLRADGRGGNGTFTLDAGDGFGGTANLEAAGAGSTITVTRNITGAGTQGNEMLSADGFGGNTNGAGDGKGGLGTGGTLNLEATSGGTVNLAPTAGTTTSDILVRIRGYGGNANTAGTTGGDAVGGIINLVVDGGTMTTGSMQLSSYAQGGLSNSLFSEVGFSASGGDASGGERNISVLNGGTLTTWIPGGVTGGSGGDASGTGTGGDGSGGTARLTVDNATLNVIGTSIVNAQNSGGSAYGGGDAGNATGGGVVVVNITNGATVNIASGAALDIGANGFGGYADNGTGGSGLGGNTAVTIANSSVLGGTLNVEAVGQGGYGLDGGGAGTGGAAQLFLNAGTIDGQALRVTAVGNGGWANSGTAGDGIGGTALLQNSGGTSAITLSSGPIEVLANGTGGDIDGPSGTGGNGTGGFAHLFSAGGALTVSAGATVNASGSGGNTPDGDGGDGTGGSAELGSFVGGALTLNGSLILLGTGLGGDGTGGIGGDGTGKVAGIFSESGGSVLVSGFVLIDSSGTGGDGDTGGMGTGGGVSSTIPEEVEIGAYLFAANGSIAIDGSMTMRADGTGGAGANGGNGGNAQGGWASIAAANRDAGPSSITISGIESSADISANATGGAGGTGTSGNAGGNGGRGGDAAAGTVSVLASAGNGTLVIDNLYGNASALGGRGGDGGNGDGEPGGNGGDGGNAWGGSVTAGTQSGAAQATGSNLGSTTFGYVSANANASGGRGGDGNFGSALGNGGNGGNATGGGALLLVRGSLVTVDTFEMFANASGGDGGTGTIGGTGGDAIIGNDNSFDNLAGIGVEVTNRFLLPDQRGTLDAGMIIGESIATGGAGGSGAANGASISEGGHGVHFRDADGSIQSLEFYVQADTLGATALHDQIAVVRGNVTVTDLFEFITPGALSFHADTGGLGADTIRLVASNFVYDSVYPAVAAPGTFAAAVFDISTGGDFITVANLDSGSGLSIFAPGSIITGNVDAVDGVYFSAYGFGSVIDVGDVTAGGNVDLYAETILGGDITAFGYINLFAGGLDTIVVGDLSGAGVYATALGNITTGNITSTLDVALTSYEASITTQNITAATEVDLDAAGNITFANVSAGDFNFDAGGAVTGGDILADSHADGEAEGAIALGNITVTGAPIDGQFSVGLTSATSILVGNVSGFDSVGFATTGNLTTGTLTAGNLVMALVGGNIVTGAISTPNSGQVYLADDSMFITGGGGSEETEFDPAIVLALAPVATGGSITINGAVGTGQFRAAAGTGITAGAITAASSIEARTGGALSLGAVEAGTFADLQAIGALSATSIDTGSGAINLLAGGTVDVGNITAGTSIFSRSTGAADFDAVSAGTSIDLGAMGALSFASASAGERARFGSDVTVTGGNVTAGDSIVAVANENITLGTLSAGIADPSTASGALYEVAIVTLGTITTQAITAAGDVQLAGKAGISTGAVTTDARMFAVSDGPISLGALDIAGTLLIGGFDMFEYTGDFDTVFDARPTFDSALVAAPGNVTLGEVNAGSFALGVGGDLTLGAITIDGFLDLFAGGNLTVNGLIDAGGSVTLGANGNISAQDILAGASVLIQAGDAVNVGDILAGQGGPLLLAMAIGPMDAGSGDPVEIFGQSIVTGDIATDGYVGLYSETFIETGAIDAGHDIIALAGTDADFGAITTPERFILAGYDNIESLYSGESFDPERIFASAMLPTGGNATFRGTVDVGSFEVYAGNDVNALDIFSNSEVRLEVGGGMALRDITATDDIDLTAVGSVTLRDANAGTEFDFDVGGSITGRNIVAGLEIAGEGAGGDVTFGNLTAGFDPGELVSEDTFSVGFTAGGNITVGTVRGAERVGFGAGGDLTTGNIEAGWDVMLFAGDDIRTGAITSGAGDNVYIADIGMCVTGGGCGGPETDFDPEIVLALAPVATGGSITIGGPVSTGTFRAAAGTGLITVAIDADRIAASAGGLATLNGMWSASDVTLVSGDIAIGDNGRIDAGSSGSIRLQAVAEDGAVIGDNVTGGGDYKLSNAEFAKISGGDITIVVGGFGGDADTLIGDLAITGPLAGSNIESSDGGVSFVTLSESGTGVDGTLRIVGDVTATGFGPDNYLSFTTQNFELDAATGLLSITGNGSELAGYIAISADRIHVADGALLDQLAGNPQFAGYREALNAPAAVQRPDGVIRAAGFEIEFLDVGSSGPHTLYVQNTGTKAVPAGFVATDADIGADGETAPPAGSIDMAINGQIVTPTGTLTGIAVRDLLVTEFGTTAFTANSTINGCALTGSCGSGPPPSAIVTPTTITVLTVDPIGEASFGNEFDIDDSVAGGGSDGEGDGDLSSPIEAPQPLFDNRPLIDEGEVDDPISGAGNPSLYGVQSDSDDDEDDDEEEDADGDGKKDSDAKKGSPVGGQQ